MKLINTIMLCLLFLLTMPAMGARITDDTLLLGKPGSAADKTLQLGPSRFIRSNESTGRLEFSEDGSLFKNIGTGSGGGDGGVNLVRNGSFEDGVTNWTNTGGTYTVEDYTNPIEGELKYGQFVASASAQNLCSDAVIIPDFLNGGCLAYSQYKTTDHEAFKIQLYSESALINEKTLPTTNGLWLQTPPVAILCPAAGDDIQVCYESLSAGTLQVDKVYKGKENRTVQTQCQGIPECEDIITFIYNGTTVVDQFGRSYGLTKSGSSNSVKSIDISQLNLTQGLRCGSLAVSASFGTFLTVSNSTSTQLQITTFNAAETGADRSFDLVCQKQSSDYAKSKPQTAVTNQQSAWFIDANIGGANPSLGASAVSSYTEITNASLDMVIRDGSAPAKIPCSGTNPSTGLTCAAGNEGVGVVFNPPTTGFFRVCFDLGHEISTNTTSASIRTTFQVVYTQNSSQAIIQEGGSRKPAAALSGSGAVTITFDRQACGVFRFSDTSEKTVRLMYEQSIAGSPAASTILADRDANNGQRDIKVTVNDVTAEFQRPVLTGDTLTTPDTSKPVLCSAQVSSTGVLSDQIGGCFASCSGTSPYTCTYTASYWAVRPNCTAVVADTSTASGVRYEIASSSSSSGLFRPVSGAPAAVNAAFSVQCHGIKN